MKRTEKPSAAVVTPVSSWAQRLGHLIAPITRRNKVEGDYARANRDAMQRMLDGADPFGARADPAAGARMVVNLSSAHVPGFCRAAQRGDLSPYKNCYDLSATHGWRVSRSRQLVDAALPVESVKSTYFGAVEVNGAGIRFYGDICLVLARSSADKTAVVLDRNSFELLRSPVADDIAQVASHLQDAARKRHVESWRGQWGSDLALIGATKVLRSMGASDRRWTISQISQAIRDDEDYIEVLRAGSFGPADLQEARVSAADAAHDALVGSRLLRGPLPRLESMIWRNRRSSAERALRAAGVKVRIVTTAGRSRG